MIAPNEAPNDAPARVESDGFELLMLEQFRALVWRLVADVALGAASARSIGDVASVIDRRVESVILAYARAAARAAHLRTELDQVHAMLPEALGAGASVATAAEQGGTRA